MGLLPDPFSAIVGLVKDGFDKLFPNPEDRLKAQELQNQITLALNDAQSKLNQAQAQIITAEAQSPSWLTANWRPMTMVAFVVLIICHFFGLDAKNLSEAQYIELFGLVKIGLGGYVAGRSLEKIADSVGDAFGTKKPNGSNS